VIGLRKSPFDRGSRRDVRCGGVRDEPIERLEQRSHGLYLS